MSIPNQTTFHPIPYAEGRAARLSGGTPHTEAMMRQILSERRLNEKYLQEIAAWLKGYEGAIENDN